MCNNGKNSNSNGKPSLDGQQYTNSSIGTDSYSSGSNKEVLKKENHPPELPPRKIMEPCNIPQVSVSVDFFRVLNCA